MTRAMHPAGSWRSRSPRSARRRASRAGAPMPPCVRALRAAASPAAIRTRDAPGSGPRGCAHFVPRSQVHDLGAHVHRRRHQADQFVERARLVRPDVEHLVPRRRQVDRLGHQRRDVIDVAERPRLRAVAEDRHRPVLENLIHEDADHVAIAVADVLTGTKHVVRAEDDVVEPEQLVTGAQVELDGVLRDPVRDLPASEPSPRSRAARDSRRTRRSKR